MAASFFARLAFGAIALLIVTDAVPAIARDSLCDGEVHGLSRQYDPDNGSGFLALRSGPGTGYGQVAELFNGDAVEIRARRGPWYNVYVPSLDISGWVYSRWVVDDCSW